MCEWLGDSPQVNHLSRNEITFILDKEIDYICDIAILSKALDALEVYQVIDFLFGHRTYQIGLHRIRTGRVDGNAHITRQFLFDFNTQFHQR